MHHEITKILGKKVIVSDGEIGSVDDVYFDDRSWVVRYIVVDTGNWLSGRTVILSPQAFKDFKLGSSSVEAELTRAQVEESPSYNTEKPISRQYEEEYYRYYNWTPYWNGPQLWGSAPYPYPSPALQPWATGMQTTPITRSETTSRPEDSHLRSIREIMDYEVRIDSEKTGTISEFIVETSTWQIVQLIVDTANLLQSKLEKILTSEVKDIDYAQSTIVLKSDKGDKHSSA